MRLLSDVDSDEVSLVKRAANRRRFLLLKGDASMDSELDDILAVPWEREGALLDAIRKEAVDETTEQALIYGIRLLKAVEAEVSPELVEKLGREMYPVQNNPLNGTKVASPGELSGSSAATGEMSGSATDGELSGSSSDGELEGLASGANVVRQADSSWDDDDEDDMGKADFSDDERKNLASQGQALPDGSYPIRNKSDLSNAIQAYGRAKDKGRAKAWIMRRAKALGATSMLPDSWVSKSDVNDDDEGGTVEFRVPVKKEDGAWDFTDVPEESQPFFKEMIAKADLAEKIQKSLDETKEDLRKSQDELRKRDYVTKAEEYEVLAPADKLGMVLKNAAETMDAERFEELQTVLKSAAARVETGDLFRELGTRALEDADQVVRKGDPWSQIEALADSLVEKSGELSKEQAIDRVLKTAEGKELYARYEQNYLSRVLSDVGGASGFGGVN